MTRIISIFALTTIAALACSKSTGEKVEPSAAPGMAGSSLTVTSTAFGDGSTVPARFTCDGENTSPALAWNAPPTGTKSLAIVVDDPDAHFTHWIVYGIDPTTRSLPDGLKTAPAGARSGKNDFGATGYGGPCPPSGEHHYVFKVYALDTDLANLENPRAADLDRAMNGHVVAQGRLTAVYEKGRGPRT